MQEREALREKLGLNDPAPIQFVRFIGNAAQGKFGLSYRTSEPVEPHDPGAPAGDPGAVASAPPCSRCCVGVPMGVYTGLYPRHWSSRLLQAVSLIGVSLPTFLIGILLILFFAVILRLAAVVRPRRDGR